MRCGGVSGLFADDGSGLGITSTDLGSNGTSKPFALIMSRCAALNRYLSVWSRLGSLSVKYINAKRNGMLNRKPKAINHVADAGLFSAIQRQSGRTTRGR